MWTRVIKMINYGHNTGQANYLTIFTNNNIPNSIFTNKPHNNILF